MNTELLLNLALLLCLWLWQLLCSSAKQSAEKCRPVHACASAIHGQTKHSRSAGILNAAFYNRQRVAGLASIWALQPHLVLL